MSELTPFRRLLETLILWATIAATFLIGGPFAVHAADWFTPTGFTGYSWWLPALILQFVRGAAIPGDTPWWFIGFVLTEILIGAVLTFLWRRRVQRRGGTRRTTAARLLNQRRKVNGLREKARTEEAQRLHPGLANIAPGLQVGVFGNRRRDCVYQGWRECGLYIFAPGRGKTFGQVVPHMIEAPGAAVMTSNKVDGVREVLAGRLGNGTRKAFILDPGGIHTDGKPTFTIDLLGQIHTMRDARELARILEDANTPDESAGKGDDRQFGPAGRAMLAAFLLAAAIDPSVNLETVYEWLSTMNALTPAKVLADHGQRGPANKLLGITKQPEKTMGSTFAVAQRMAEALSDDDMLTWTTPTPGIPAFSPQDFVRSRDTLILLSQDDDAAGGALVAATVRAVCKTAEQYAAANGGRLPVPLVLELDELANIVRWRGLPKAASHYGSKGIVVNGYLQSYQQGVLVFGQGGMDAYKDACSIRVYGGGSDDTRYLENLTKLIGKKDNSKVSVTTGRGGRSTQLSTNREVILDIDDLAGLPDWHAIVFSTKALPAYIRTRPWWNRPDLAEIITPNLEKQK